MFAYRNPMLAKRDALNEAQKLIFDKVMNALQDAEELSTGLPSGQYAELMDAISRECEERMQTCIDDCNMSYERKF